jgi:hypothetical protein
MLTPQSFDLDLLKVSAQAKLLIPTFKSKCAMGLRRWNDGGLLACCPLQVWYAMMFLRFLRFFQPSLIEALLVSCSHE